MVALRHSVLLEVQATPANESPRLPVHILLAEAARLAAYVDRTWATANDHPGLRSASLHLGPDISNDLLGLTVAIQGALAPTPSAAEALKLRAERLHDEIAAVLRFFFHEGQPAAPASAPTVPVDTTLCTRLIRLAALANRHRGALEGWGGFTSGMIREALQLCVELPERSAASQELRPFAVVLERKIALVRAAARFAFRHQPALAREALSAIDEPQQLVLEGRALMQSATQLPSEEATLY